MAGNAARLTRARPPHLRWLGDGRVLDTDGRALCLRALLAAPDDHAGTKPTTERGARRFGAGPFPQRATVRIDALVCTVERANAP
ncbi:MAG TPA: hypothetical protein VM925_04695 [Labilithrix sp.]|nr:hypothetical protein [Labilithrix sp.]